MHCQSSAHKISTALFAGILSAVNLVLYNIPFMAFISQHLEEEPFRKVLVLASVTVVFLLLHFFVFYLLVQCLRYVGRALIALFFFLSGVCIYFIAVYHTMMDGTMMDNVFNTRWSEASGFMTPGLFIAAALMGLLPAVYVLWQPIKRDSWKRFGWCCGGSLLLSVVLALLNMNQVLWIGKYDTELGGLVMPWSYTVNSARMYAIHKAENKEEILLPDARFVDEDKSVFVLVIGESARKANWQLYGYERETNPRLSRVEDLHIYQAQSCATYTTAGVKSILEYADKDDLYEILPNYIFRTGGDVTWRTSNWGEPPVHIDEYLTRTELAEQNDYDGPKYDDLLFAGLKQRILNSTKRKLLVVIHTSTGHGPDYQRQYPEQYAHFLPVCSRVENAEKEPERLMNAYDNTTVFTDAYLADLIDTLRTITDRHCAMLYVSDHGESLGENGLFMHGVPMRIAPKEQYEIPFLLWTSANYLTLPPRTDVIDQHYVFHTVLRWLSIDSPIYNKEKDLFE